MHFYKTILRLDGSTMNEVVKIVSAPELLVLQFIHGGDACTRVEEVKNVKIDMLDEKQRLKVTYESALARREQSIDSIFGALGTLPKRLPPEVLEQFNIYGDGLDVPDVNEKDIKEFANKSKSPMSNHPDVPKNQTEIDNLNRIKSSDEVSIADLMG